jgi:hypothetical protein
MDFGKALEQAICHDAELFVGAGFSLGAKCISGNPIKVSGGFRQLRGGGMDL